jgi:UDP-N-acetylglucosamine 2-epimerase (non-hydrolysing)
MRRILIVFGTRPEAIKLVPLIFELRSRPNVRLYLCSAGQHREMLREVLKNFSVDVDFDLDVMTADQTPLDVSRGIFLGLPKVLRSVAPDLLIVQGDTATACAAALEAYSRGIAVCHVEAGLRTHNIYSPYPEELNRLAISAIASIHCAPTEGARENLLAEGICAEDVYLTGNTVIDTMRLTLKKEFSHPVLDWASGYKLLILTVHRRENIGEPMEKIFAAVKELVRRNPEIKIFYPVHPNPSVASAARCLCGEERILMDSPASVREFHNIMSRCFLILTDSGGIQEEATALGKPVLLLRSETERPEGLENGNVIPVGCDRDAMINAAERLLKDEDEYKRVSRSAAVFGDGNASSRIADIICERFKN